MKNFIYRALAGSKTKLFTLLFAVVANVGTLFAESGTCGDNLTWELTNGVLTISGTGAMKDYSYRSYAPWYSDRASITSVIINDGVTNIGSYAFYHCIGLTSIEIPNSVTNIGSYAFADCTGLTSVTIGENVTSIGSGAFAGCSGLTSIEIPNSVTSIGNSAFSGCSGLTSIIIPNSVTSIGDYAFDNCTGLTSVIWNAKKCKDFRSSSHAPFFSSGQITSFVFGDEVEHIPAYLCYNKLKLSNITIPNSVTRIGEMAFYHCIGLTSVTIPNSVTSIGNWAFRECSNLTSIIWNAKKCNNFSSSISPFNDSRTKITSFVFGDEVEYIPAYLCNGMSQLNNITIPNSVTSIGYGAFEGCTDLTSPVYNAHVFAYMPTSYKGTYTIPDGIESIAGGAFYGCSSLTSITLPNSIMSIGENAFYNCDNLKSIIVPCGELQRFRQMCSDSRLRYAPSPYTIRANWTSNGYVNIPSYSSCDDSIQVSAQPNRGFYFVQWSDGNTDNPRTIKLTQDMTIEAVFDYQLSGKCGKDNVLSWKFDPSKMALEITGKGALSGNYTYGTFIESLTIGNEVTSIGQSAFYGCYSLKNVIIGSSVKVLENYAFSSCYAIKTITCYSQRPPTVNEGALSGLDYSTIVYVPANYFENYNMHDFWGLYDVRPIDATVAETNEVTVTPSETTAEVVWPAISGADSYEMVIKDQEGNIICTLIFNANGRLTQIAFNAPAQGNAPQQTQQAGFSFIVIGLDSGTSYDLSITAKNAGGQEIDKKNISFHTNGLEPIDNVLSDKAQSTKVLRDGKLFILRGEHVFDAQGKMVR